MKLYILEPSARHSGPILVCDEAHNDIAEFFHNEHATVGQSYEAALALAKSLVSFQETAEFARRAVDRWISDGVDDDLLAAFIRLSNLPTVPTKHICSTGDGEVCPVCGRMGNGEGVRIEGHPQEA